MSEDAKPEAAEEAPAEAKKKPKKTKSKKSKPGAGAAGRTTLAVSISGHPRAQRSIRRARARTAIVAFVIVLILSHRSGVPNQEAVVRALLAGLAGNLAGWACAMGVWRQLIMGELRIVEDVRRDRRHARAEAAAAAAAARAERSASASAS